MYGKPEQTLTRLSGPVMVYVFPDPVWPYAKAVQEYLKQQNTSQYVLFTDGKALDSQFPL